MRFRFAALVAVVAALAVAASASAAVGRNAAAPIKIKVTAGEFFFKFSRTSVPKGSTVIFTLHNAGNTGHNLAFTTLGKATPVIDSGATATLKVVFAKAGKFAYICSVPRHAEQGMAGKFVVK